MLYIHDATILTPQRQLEQGAVLIEGQRIMMFGPQHVVPCPAGATRLDAEGLLLAPGFIDLQLNGAFGHDFTADPSTIWAVAERLPQYGVTAFLPTIITAPLSQVAAAQQVLAAGPPDGWQGALPLGLHLEGPFLNPQRKGAHNPAHLRPPTATAVADWSPMTGVRLVTMAPELPGALDVIELLAAHGVVVSAGHSCASYAEANAGFAAGVRYGTHLFNAMPPLNHREPGLAGALLNSEATVSGIIPDGIHVHPAMVMMAWQVLGPAGLNLVTDAMAALGMPAGAYQLGDYAVTVDATSARLADGTLAGSVLALDAALRNLMEFTGCSLREALPTVTVTPARLLGLGYERGAIAPGTFADLVLLTPTGHVQTTIARGQIVYDRKAEYVA
jgi:N-acetylglucosamine-6-phosphate deacetylase